jgi:hypothetical protein
MTGGTQTFGEQPLRMRANRKVLETQCLICNLGFTLGEEVYACSVCGGYHHTLCWDRTQKCPRQIVLPVAEAPAPTIPAAALPFVETPPQEPPRVAPPLEVGAPAAPEFSFTLEQPPQPTAPPEAPPQAAPKPEPPPATPLSPWEQEMATTYARWETPLIERALIAERTSYHPAALPILEAELRKRGVPVPVKCSRCGSVNPASATTCNCGNSLEPSAQAPAPTPERAGLAPDERRCPTCAEIIKKDALKCRFCGQILDSRLAAEEVPNYIVRDIESSANTSLTCGIISIFVCQPILGPIAIVKGNKVRKLLDQFPAHAGKTSARGKATAGTIIGWIMVILWVIIMISMLASIR